jgi:hypothetical protein
MRKTIKEKVVSCRTATPVHACVLDCGGDDAALSRTACPGTLMPCGPHSQKSASIGEICGFKRNQTKFRPIQTKNYRKVLAYGAATASRPVLPFRYRRKYIRKA